MKAVGRAVKWVVTNEQVRAAALQVAYSIILKKQAEKDAKKG